MKLKNGWLHKKSYIKAVSISALVLLAGIGFCCYEVFGRKASTTMVVLYALLAFMLAAFVFTSFYSKDMREFSDQVNQVYMSMDPKPFYDFVSGLELDTLADETKTKLAFFMAWFYHFEGKNEEAKEMFYAKAVTPFPYPTMLSLKCLIEIYLLDDKNNGYTVVKNTLKELEECPKINKKMKAQLEQEIKGQILRLDVITSGEASDEVINSLKGQASPFEYVQNQAFLTYLLKDKDPKTAYEAKEYVLKNYGKFEEYKNIVEKIDVVYDPSQEPKEEETKEIENVTENSTVIENEETPVINEEVVNEVVDEEVKEEVKEDQE